MNGKVRGRKRPFHNFRQACQSGSWLEWLIKNTRSPRSGFELAPCQTQFKILHLSLDILSELNFNVFFFFFFFKSWKPTRCELMDKYLKWLVLVSVEIRHLDCQCCYCQQVCSPKRTMNKYILPDTSCIIQLMNKIQALENWMEKRRTASKHTMLWGPPKAYQASAQYGAFMWHFIL
jgi:hypothetical protein